MRLKIAHTTRYAYDAPVPYAMQRVRLWPRDGATQKIASWSLAIDGAHEEVRFQDQFANETRLLSVSGGIEAIEIVATGEVDTVETAGVVGPHTGYAPLWLFLAETERTVAGPLVNEIAHEVGSGTDLERLHQLKSAIRERVAYRIGATDSGTTAEEAIVQGEGVCQDHAHIFLAAARKLGFPGRYVSGYLLMDGVTNQVATHAWAEAHVPGLGWVSFDVSNGISADERYVRIATGRDYRDAMPVSGVRMGTAQEQLEVHITVEQ